MTAQHHAQFGSRKPLSGLSPLDIAGAHEFTAAHHARKAAIYAAPEGERAAMTRALERETAAFSRGAGRGL